MSLGSGIGETVLLLGSKQFLRSGHRLLQTERDEPSPQLRGRVVGRSAGAAKALTHHARKASSQGKSLFIKVVLPAYPCNKVKVLPRDDDE